MTTTEFNAGNAEYFASIGKVISDNVVANNVLYIETCAELELKESHGKKKKRKNLAENFVKTLSIIKTLNNSSLSSSIFFPR